MLGIPTDYRRGDRGDDFPVKIASGRYYIITTIIIYYRRNVVKTAYDFTGFAFCHSLGQTNDATTEIRTVIIMIAVPK